MDGGGHPTIWQLEASLSPFNSPDLPTINQAPGYLTSWQNLCRRVSLALSHMANQNVVFCGDCVWQFVHETFLFLTLPSVLERSVLTYIDICI